MKIKLLLFYIILVFSKLTLAQNFPVTVVPQAVSPSPIYFSSYADLNASSSPLRVQITLNDITISNLQVRLKIYFEGNGINFQSNDVVIGANPLFLEGGAALRLTNTDLAPYFSLQNITGINSNQYAAAIPEGSYRFCFEVYDVFTGNRLSSKSCAATYIFKNEPPFLVLPHKNETIDVKNPQNIMFQWTPRHINVSNVEYELSIVEVWDNYVDPQAAFFSIPPIFQTTTKKTSYLLGPSDPMLLPNKKYAWRVQAKALVGLEEIGLFNNNGYSEVFWFNHSQPCKPPENVKSEVKGTHQANISWDDFTTDIPEYKIRYREKNNSNSNQWFYSRSNTDWVTIWDLRPGTVYEYQVNRRCEIIESDYSPIKTFTTFLADDESGLYSCGLSPEMSVTNKEPLPELLVNDVFKAGDFPIKVLEVSGSNGRFTGKGYVSMPYLKNIKVAVEFTNVLVNTDKQLAEGMVITVYDATWSNMLDIDEVIDIADDIQDVFTGGDNTILDPVDYAIDSIIVKDGRIVVTGTNGEQTTYDYDKEDTYQISGTNGVFAIDKNGNVSKLGEIAEGGPATADNTNGIDPSGKGTVTSPSVSQVYTEGVTVLFRKGNETKYELDMVDNTFEESTYPRAKRSDGSDYYPVHKAVVNGNKDVFYADITIANKEIHIDSLIFKTVETGLKLKADKIDNDTYKIEVEGKNAYRNEEAIITYRDATGKQRVIASFFIHHLHKLQTRKVQIVTVNGASSIESLNATLNDVFGVAGASFDVNSEIHRINIAPSVWDIDENNGILDYNGSGLLPDYPKEIRAIHQYYMANTANYDNKAYYLFVVDESIKVSKAINGFMPKGRQFGYIFNAYQNEGLGAKDSQNNVAAHELGHGVFSLEHPFESDSNAGNTQWLMDYNANGIQLPFTHWAVMSDTGLNLQLFQKDEDGELIQKIITKYLDINLSNWQEYGFLSPIGTAIILDNATHVKFNEDGAVIAFKLGGKEYLGAYSASSQTFMGYISEDHSGMLKGGVILTEEFYNEFESKRFKNINYAPLGKTIFAIAKKKYQSSYLDCIFEATWTNNKISSSHIGKAKPPFIAEDALIIDLKGSQCTDAVAEGVLNGVGINIYYALISNISENEKSDLIDFANYMTNYLKDKTFSFYGHGLEDYWTNNIFGQRVLRYLRDNKIYSLDKFRSKEHFPIETYSRDVNIIFSNIDIREGIPDGYNSKTTDWVKFRNSGNRIIYEYSLSDLEARMEYMNGNSVLKTAIIDFENQGTAEAISTRDGYDQYVAKYGTDSAIFAWAEFAANSSKDVMMAFFAHRLAAQHGVALMKQAVEQLSKEAVQKFVKGASIEAISNIIANEVLGGELKYDDFILDVFLAGMKEVISPDKKLIDAGFDCVIGLDNANVIDLINSKDFDQFLKNFIVAGGQCIIPAVLGSQSEKFKNYILQNKIFAQYGYKFFKDKVKLGTPQTVGLMKRLTGFDDIFKNKNSFYKEVIEEVLAEESGAIAIDVLIKAGFDISKLSSRNLKRLSSIISKHGYSEALVDLFKGTRDVNRMLIFLDNIVNSPKEYVETINKIAADEMFSKTITINSKTLKVSEFFDDMGDAYQYYHKVEGNVHYFAKLKDREGMLITLDYSIKTSYETSIEIIKELWTDYNEEPKEMKVNDMP